MPCFIVPKPPIPKLPFPITFGASLPVLPKINVALPCCVQPIIATPPVSIPMPSGVMNPAIVKVITQALDKVDAFLDTIAFDCPRD